MQQPSRRQFVAASLAGLPMLAQSSTAAPAKALPLQSASAAQLGIGAVDPVLAETIANLRELVSEGDAKPASRKEMGRAIETLMGIQAAHIGLHYDPHIQRALKRRIGRVGRAIFVDEIVKSARDQKRHHVTHELVDEALTKLAQHGFAGCIRDVQRAVRAARLHAPDAFLAAALRPAQYDFCSDIKWIIEFAEMVAGIICIIAMAEPTFALEPFCAAAQATVLTYKAMQWWWC